MNSKITKSKLTSPKLVRSSPKSVPQAAKGEQIFSCQFEVFGHVQGKIILHYLNQKLI